MSSIFRYFLKYLKNRYLLWVFGTFVFVLSFCFYNSFCKSVPEEEEEQSEEQVEQGVEQAVEQEESEPEQEGEQEGEQETKKQKPILDLPVLGKFELEVTIDPVTKTPVFKATPLTKEIDLVVAKISNPLFVVNPALMKVYFEGRLLVFDYPVTDIALEEFEPPVKLLFSFKLVKPLALSLGEFKQTIVEKFYLLLTPKEKRLYTRIPLGIQEATYLEVSFGKDTNVFAQCTIPRVSLGDFIPDLKKIKIGDVQFTDLSLKVIDPFKPDNRWFVANGKINLSALGLTNILGKDPIVKCTLNYNDIQGLTCEAFLPSTIKLVPGLINLENPKITFIYKREVKESLDINEKEEVFYSKTLRLDGITNFKFPGLPSQKINLTAFFKDNGFFYFEGAYQSKLGYKNVISLYDTVLKAIQDPVKKTFSVGISGRGHLLGEEVIGNLSLEQRGLKEFDISFSAALATPKPLKPFESIPGLENIPGIKDITIKEVGIGMDTTGMLFFKGRAVVLGLDSNVKLIRRKIGVISKTEVKKEEKIEKDKDASNEDGTVEPAKVERIEEKKAERKGEHAVVLYASPVNKWTVADIIPGSTGTGLEKLAFSDSAIIVSSRDNIDPELNVNLFKGFCVLTKTGLVGPLKPVNILLRDSAPDKITLVISFGASAKDFRCYADIPVQVKFSNKVCMKKLKLEFISAVSANPAKPVDISFSLACTIEVKLKDKERPLFFTGRVKFDPKSAAIAGTMEGRWDKPFGIKGLSLYDVALEIGIEFAVFSTTGLPSVFGITGGMDIGSVKAAMAVKTMLTSPDVLLMGRINKLSLMDLVEVVRKMGIKIPKKVIPEIGISDVDIKIAPVAGYIGEIKFDKGYTVKGRVDLLGQSAMVNFVLDGHTGIIAEGTMSKLKLGPLEITGAGLDKVYGTADDGPTVSIYLTMARQDIYASGIVTLLGSKGQIEVRFGKSGITFFTTIKFLNLFDTEIKGESIKTGQDDRELDFKITGLLRNDFRTYLQDKVLGILTKSEQKVDEGIEKAQKKLASARKTVKEQEEKVKKLQDEIDHIEKSHKEKKESAQKKLSDAQREVDRLQGEINNTNNRINYCKKAKWYRADLKAEIVPLGAKLVGLHAAHKIALGVLEGVKKLVGIIPTGIDPRIPTLYSTKLAALGALKIAQGTLVVLEKGVLESTQQVTKGVFEAGKIIAKFAGVPFDIRRAEISATVQGILRHGVFPKVILDVTILGKKVNGLEFQLDVSRPQDLIKQIVNAVVKVIKP